MTTIPQDLRSVRVRAAELQQAMLDRRAWEAEHAAELHQAMVDQRAAEAEDVSTDQPTLFTELTAGDL